MGDIPWGDIISAAGSAAITGAGSYFTAQQAAEDQAARDRAAQEAAAALSAADNAAALERLKLQLASGGGGGGGGANSALQAKVSREKMLQDAFANIIQTAMQGRNNQSAAFNNLITAGQSAALSR